MNNFNFPFVKAHYRSDPASDPALNAYIEAMPELPDDLTLARALRNLPRFDPAERLLPGPARIQRLDLLQTLVVPLPRLIRLARAVIKLMHTGYSRRRPFSLEDNETLKLLYQQQQSGVFVSARQSGGGANHSMALVGASGCGKSYGMRHIAGLFPPAIYHEQIGKWQLPSIFVEMPYDGESLHTLASAIFAELDRLMPDAGYTELFEKGMNATRRLALALSLAYKHGVGMIFVDEAQNQKSVGNVPTGRTLRNAGKTMPKNETPLMKLLITASNTSNMPLCLSGTLEMQAVVGTRFSKSRRGSGRGSSQWLPLQSSGMLEAPDEFELMLKALWNYVWLQNVPVLNDGWVKLFFELTQGIPDIMVKLFESSQEAAIANRSETLTEELVRSIFAKEFFLSELGIIGLRDKNRYLLDIVPDLYQPDPLEAALEVSNETTNPREDAAEDVEKVLLKAARRRERAVNPPKPVRKAPEPALVSVELAAASDLRSSTLGASGGERLNHVAMGAQTPS